MAKTMKIEVPRISRKLHGTIQAIREDYTDTEIIYEQRGDHHLDGTPITEDDRLEIIRALVIGDWIVTLTEEQKEERLRQVYEYASYHRPAMRIYNYYEGYYDGVVAVLEALDIEKPKEASE